MQKFSTLAQVYFATFVDLALLICIFIISMLATSVLVSALYFRRSSPTVFLLSQQNLAYVTFDPFGTWFLLMK